MVPEQARHTILNILHQPMPHSGLILDLSYDPIQQNWGVILYRENFDEFSNEHKVDLIVHLQSVMEKIAKAGIPCYLEMKGELPR